MRSWSCSSWSKTDVRSRRPIRGHSLLHVVALPTPPRVLVLTTFDHNEYVYEAMKWGASGFLLKDVRKRAADRCDPEGGRRGHTGRSGDHTPTNRGVLPAPLRRRRSP